MGTYADRNAAIQEHSSFEVIYQPQLPIFNIDHALPCGSYQLTLNPVSLDQLKIRAIQAKDGSVDLSQYSFSIETMYLYINQVQGPRFDSGTFLIDMDNVRCQAEKISSLSLQQKSFDISPNANQVTVAFQDDRLTSGAVSPSIFKAYPTNLSGTSALKNDAGLGLNRLFITYNGENQPSPDGDMTLTGDIDFTQQYYFETLCNTGAMYSEGGCESLEDWKGDRGAYYTFNFPKDGTSRSTWLQVNSQFDGSISGAAGQEHLRLLLFDSYKSCAKVQVEAGRVVNCIVEEV
jgi:hypothetical protein